jgi:hypothetical protein
LKCRSRGSATRSYYCIRVPATFRVVGLELALA